MDDNKCTIPSIGGLCSSHPLYEQVSIVTSADWNRINALLFGEIRIDFYCIGCKDNSVFITPERQKNGYEDLQRNRRFDRVFSCSRDTNHQAIFFFRIANKGIEKIGQWPSLADLAQSEIRHYRAALAPESFREFSRAVGLASHGVGIGSFVYLRRIFEGLIEKAHLIAKKEPAWVDADFQSARMDGKIKMLQHLLPEFLVEQRALYSILSAGIHALTENKCLEAFPVVRTGIELILDQEIARKMQMEKMERAKKQLTALTSEIKEA